jgi:hypothetical protein
MRHEQNLDIFMTFSNGCLNNEGVVHGPAEVIPPDRITNYSCRSIGIWDSSTPEVRQSAYLPQGVFPRNSVLAPQAL